MLGIVRENGQRAVAPGTKCRGGKRACPTRIVCSKIYGGHGPSALSPPYIRLSRGITRQSPGPLASVCAIRRSRCLSHRLLAQSAQDRERAFEREFSRRRRERLRVAGHHV